MSVYAYLNIEDPICAWATYRGVLVSSPETKGFVSVWLSGLLKSQNKDRLLLEQKLEAVRKQFYPNCASRLKGMFCFQDLESAELAARHWGGGNSNHFSTSNLAELGLHNIVDCLKQFDANWITRAQRYPKQTLKNNSWMHKYWSGKPYSEDKPIWESLYVGQMEVYGTNLRNSAYKRLKKEFPDSLAFLEIARIAALLGSNLGSIHGFILNKLDSVELNYCMNMEDADNPIFLEELGEFMQSKEPINYKDLDPHIRNGSFGHIPDLRPYGHTW